MWGAVGRDMGVICVIWGAVERDMGVIWAWEHRMLSRSRKVRWGWGAVGCDMGVVAQDAFAFAKDPLCEEVLYPTISGTGKGACPFGFVRRSLKEKASFLFQTPSNKTVLRLCRRTPEIVVTHTGFNPVTF